MADDSFSASPAGWEEEDALLLFDDGALELAYPYGEFLDMSAHLLSAEYLMDVGAREDLHHGTGKRTGICRRVLISWTSDSSTTRRSKLGCRNSLSIVDLIRDKNRANRHQAPVECSMDMATNTNRMQREKRIEKM